mmetsp:Transcript_22042/g.83861  ORF Transcript_22042/g.83861 Transcript_22042/m.83861 type:complete len:214 (+) Transcript_22042:109-750(+)
MTSPGAFSTAAPGAGCPGPGSETPGGLRGRQSRLDGPRHSEELLVRPCRHRQLQRHRQPRRPRPRRPARQHHGAHASVGGHACVAPEGGVKLPALVRLRLRERAREARNRRPHHRDGAGVGHGGGERHPERLPTAHRGIQRLRKRRETAAVAAELRVKPRERRLCQHSRGDVEHRGARPALPEVLGHGGDGLATVERCADGPGGRDGCRCDGR